MSIQLHKRDLPDGLDLGPVVAIDTETMGLNLNRDRLCLVARLLADERILKLFHFARFDIAALKRAFGVTARPVYCTKIASKLVRTFTDRHGLKDLVKDLANVDLSKQQQSSDWGAAELTQEQMVYAASDVLYLHTLKARLDQMLARERRTHLAEACFAFLPFRAELDLAGWADQDIFQH
jgi:ribonuclease D